MVLEVRTLKRSRVRDRAPRKCGQCSWQGGRSVRQVAGHNRLAACATQVAERLEGEDALNGERLAAYYAVNLPGGKRCSAVV